MRSFSKSFSAYEYPLATEPPEVTTTSAEEAAKGSSASPDNQQKAFKTRNNDDNLTDLEIQHIRNLQNQHMSTTLKGSQPITLEVPSEIPPNVPSSSLEVPEATITTLENGLRVVSQETYGQVCAVGLLCDFGSRHEELTGTAHLVETLSFPSTRLYPDPAATQQLLQDWGATHFCSVGREQSIWCLDILRPNVEKGMELLQQVTLEPTLDLEEIEWSKKAMEWQTLDIMPEFVLAEAIQEAAYGSDQQLGKRHICEFQANVDRIGVCDIALLRRLTPLCFSSCSFSNVDPS